MQKHPPQSTKFTHVLRYADGSLNHAHYRHRAEDERVNAIQALAQLFVGWAKKN